MTGPGRTDPATPVLLLGAHWYEDDPGGLHRYFADLFRSLRATGLHPTGVVAGPAAHAPVGVVASGHFRRPFPIRLASYARAVRRTAASTGFTLVDAHFAFYAFWPVVAGRLRRLPLVVHFQGPWAEESAAAGDADTWRIAAKRRVEATVYRRAREVVVLSDAFRRVLVERYGVSPWRVSVVPPGIDLDRFTPGDKAAARAHLGLPADAPVVVSVRRLVPRMGLDVLVEAWSAVASAQPNARLVIGGDGPERARLERLAGRLRSSGSVRFLGMVDDETVVRCYQAADLSVVPTVALEGFGLVVLESLACGTPPIVTDAGGLPEAVRSLDSSLVVEAGDAAGLAARLVKALDGTQPVPDATRCRAHAEAYAWPLVAERHRVIYARAAGTAPTRPRVVYVDHCAQLSGGELALLHLLPALDVDAHVILGEDGPLVAKLQAIGVPVEVLAMADEAGALHRDRVRPGRLPVAAVAHTGAHLARLARRLRQLRPDLVHTNSLKSALYGGAAARLVGIPAVWHIRDRITDDYLPPAACRLVRAAARVLPTAIIANSKTTQATLGRAGYGAVAIASPLGIRPGSAVPDPDEGALGRPLRVGIVGRLDHWKGQHVFLDAFAKAFPGGEEQAVLVGAPMFGAEAYAERLAHQVAALGLDGRVEFRGFREDVESELRRLDILVHASTIPEPYGQVVVEGMAAGLAVVAAGAGGPAEVVDHGVDGLLYPPGDADALARALQLLASDRPLRRQLGSTARLRAEDFTPARISPRVMAVYGSVLQCYGSANDRAPGAAIVYSSVTGLG